MNESIRTLMERRSIRKYKKDMPTDEEIRTVIDAGLMAASGKNLQTPIIICLKNREIIERLRKINAEIMGLSEDGDPFYGAPMMLIVLADRSQENYIYDGSLTMGNMMNAAHAIGLGSCWVNRAKEEFEMPEWRGFLKGLGIEGDYEGIGHLILGYPEKENPKALKRKEGRVFFA